MKLLKLTMLAATAALAASAFIGASSASALTTHPVIQLCDVPQLVLCEEKHLLTPPSALENSKLVLLVGEGEFNAGFVTVKCTSGEGESQSVEKEAGMGNKFKTTLEKLTFTGCSGCTGVAVKVPQEATLSMGSELGEDWTISAPGSKVKFTGCALSQSCTYEGNLTFLVKMDEVSAYADPESKEFKKVASESTSLCAETGKWTKGRTRVDLRLDDAKKSIHINVTPTLLEVLDLVTPVEL